MLRFVAAALVAVALLAGGAGCAGSGPASCGVDGCVVTIPRSATVAVSVLGVDVRLVEIRGDAAEIEVAGSRISVPVGGEAQVGGFTVGVERVTDTEVVVRVRP